MSSELFGLLIVAVSILLFFGGLVYNVFFQGPKRRDMRQELGQIGSCCRHGRG